MTIFGLMIAGCSIGQPTAKKTSLPNPAWLHQNVTVTVTSPQDAAGQFVAAIDRGDKATIYALLTPTAQQQWLYNGYLSASSNRPQVATNTVGDAVIAPDGQTARVAGKMHGDGSKFLDPVTILAAQTPKGWRITGIAYPLYGGTENLQSFEKPHILTSDEIEQMKADSFHHVFSH